MKKLVMILAAATLAACAQPRIDDGVGVVGPISTVAVAVPGDSEVRWGAQDRIYAQRFAGTWPVSKPMPNYESIVTSDEARAFVRDKVVASVSQYSDALGGAAGGAPATLTIDRYVISSGTEHGFIGRDHVASYTLSTATGSVSGTVEVDEVVGAVGLLVRSVNAPADERLSRAIVEDALARSGG